MTTIREDAESSPSPDLHSALIRYPEGLFEWAGHKAGGVRRLFYDAYGRPSGTLIETPLLARLRLWAERVASSHPDTPRTVLLVGGPGNGKTEAIEVAIRELEQCLALDRRIVSVLTPRFNPTDGSMVPRSVAIDLRALGLQRPLVLTLVQDASVNDASLPGMSAAQLLVKDLEDTRNSPENIYLACVNRGVLDDALIVARKESSSQAHGLLECTIRAVGAGLALPSCWPLAEYPEVAIWPMDMESLFTEQAGAKSPADQALTVATSEDQWPAVGTCPARDRCPYCHSRDLLNSGPHKTALLRVLRYYEIATGKRWSFRDLFSLLSFLLAGSPQQVGRKVVSPCEWAAHLIEIDQTQVTRPDATKLAAPFLLVAAQFQHALFASWPGLRHTGLRPLLRELNLSEHPTLLGLHHFLVGNRSKSIPRSLQDELANLGILLDPAMASPDQEVEVSARSVVALREVDTRFSHSVYEGLESVRKYHCLSNNEVDVLRRLAEADDLLGSPDVRRRRPSAASQIQAILRDFACRLVRRNLGMRTAVVRDVSFLHDFEALIRGDLGLYMQAAKQVEGLLNEGDNFTVTLNSTFGEPPPPDTRQVVLETQKQKVRPAAQASAMRPDSDLRFLTVGSSTRTQSIPLTYELFRSVRELQDGLLTASLPRSVRAALDAARARFAGRIVRDEEALDGAEIRIGIRTERIAREMGQFIVRDEADS